ncbi:MAG: 1-acyl-sn-glycerol-3-phosphate acyltransferase [Burkholderiales bacterium]|nr:1-acyl-sn-glycerol-3-phosphate acyltransferase [Phycisphaerae bacterium]
MHLDRLDRPGPFVIACTHISHLEPFLLSSMMERPVHWIARAEMYRNPLVARILRLAGSIPIRRASRAVRAIRTSIDTLGRGGIVGIFPEAGVAHGRDAIIRGGAFKGGASLIAVRAGVPILPVVMLGTDKLNAVEPWLPGSRTKIWIGVGEPVMSACKFDAPISERRIARLELSRRLGNAFVTTYGEMRGAFELRERQVP